MALSSASRSLTQEIRSFIAQARFDPGEAPPEDEGRPRITIITPSFNQADFLERTIISIHNQQYPNLEHIVIDGGSTDASVEIIKKYEKRLAYWHSRPDAGQCDAINSGAARATGHFMTWINSDDLLLPGALDTVARRLEQEPDVDLLYGNQVELDEEDRVTKRIFTMDFDIRHFLYEPNIIAPQQSSFWRTELFRSLGGLGECPYAMDYEFFYRLFRNGARFARTNSFLSGFRIYGGSLTGSGEVARNRDATLDGIFRDYTGRERTASERRIAPYLWKLRRMLTVPGVLTSVTENRIYRLLRSLGIKT